MVVATALDVAAAEEAAAEDEGMTTAPPPMKVVDAVAAADVADAAAEVVLTGQVPLFLLPLVLLLIFLMLPGFRTCRFWFDCAVAIWARPARSISARELSSACETACRLSSVWEVSYLKSAGKKGL